MAGRFARVTVVADERSIDVSLPTDRPIAELMPQLRDLLSVPPQAAGAWAVSTMSAGALDPQRSLDEAGIVDADLLYLTRPSEAATAPAVDDVLDEVQSTLDNDGGAWEADARISGSAALAGIVIVALTAAVPFMALRSAGITALLGDLVVSASIAGWLMRGRGGEFIILAAVPAAVLAGIEVARLVMPAGQSHVATVIAAAGLAGGGLGCALFVLAGPRWHTVAAAGDVLALFGILAAGLLIAGLDVAPVAAVLAVVAAFAAGLVPQLALARSRLVHLLRAEEAGQRTTADELLTAVRRGHALLTGAVAGIAIAAALAAAVLVTSRTWFAVILGSVLGAVFGLRSRAFTRASQVWPMLLPGVAVAAVAAIVLPRWLSTSQAVTTWIAFGGPLLLIVLVVVAGRAHLGEVGAARLRQLLDLAELLAVLGLVPLAVAVYGGFSLVR